jgi:hypothetical protein
MKINSIFKIIIIFIFAFTSVVIGQDVPKVEGLVDIKYAERIITVGGAGADITGYTSEAIQLAVDALKTRGSGTVLLKPGQFEIIAPVRLNSNMSLIGSGEKTVLHKCNGFKTNFVVDADWGMQKASVKDPSGFKVGMAIQLLDDSHKGGWDVTTAKITAINGNVIYFDNRTVNDYIASKNGVISNACSIVEGVEVENVKIANFAVEGNKKSNDYINGCRGGGIYLHKSKNCLIENVKVNEFNGDTFSWQITENITVRNCEASYGNGLGFHPGTGSDHPIIEKCRTHNNSQDGIFLCWRVQNGIFKDNVSYGNGRFGISIGHQDTDNLFVNNHIYENAQHGINFRNETEQNSGHRNTFKNNIIENNGNSSFKAYGFYIGGNTRDIIIENNTIRSTGKGNQVGAVGIGKNSSRINLKSNNVSGCEELVQEK